MPNRQQKKKLKELKKAKILKCDGISESDMEIYKYLKSLGYVKIIYDSEFQRTQDGIKLLPTTPLEIHLEEPGKDYLASDRTSKIERWIPIAISFLALMKSYGIIDKIVTLCKQLLELLSQSE